MLPPWVEALVETAEWRANDSADNEEAAEKDETEDEDLDGRMGPPPAVLVPAAVPAAAPDAVPAAASPPPSVWCCWGEDRLERDASSALVR